MSLSPVHGSRLLLYIVVEGSKLRSKCGAKQSCNETDDDLVEKMAGLRREIHINSPFFISMCVPGSGWNRKKSLHRSLIPLSLFFLPRRGTKSNASFTGADIFVISHRSPALVAMTVTQHL